MRSVGGVVLAGAVLVAGAVLLAQMFAEVSDPESGKESHARQTDARGVVSAVTKPQQAAPDRMEVRGGAADAGVDIEVVDATGAPVAGCRVVATRRQVRSARAIDNARSLAALDLVFDGACNQAGRARVPLGDEDVYVRVCSPQGLFAVGAERIVAGARLPERYVVPTLVGCAFHLADGAVARHVRCESEGLSPAGLDELVRLGNEARDAVAKVPSRYDPVSLDWIP